MVGYKRKTRGTRWMRTAQNRCECKAFGWWTAVDDDVALCGQPFSRKQPIFPNSKNPIANFKTPGSKYRQGHMTSWTFGNAQKYSEYDATPFLIRDINGITIIPGASHHLSSDPSPVRSPPFHAEGLAMPYGVRTRENVAALFHPIPPTHPSSLPNNIYQLPTAT